MIFIDTNVFVEFLFGGEKEEQAARILEDFAELVTSETVYREVLWVIARTRAYQKFNIKGKYEFRELIRRNGFDFCSEELNTFRKMLSEFNVLVLKDYFNQAELINTMIKYHLLPSDAQIVITCMHYNIKDIASFDSDFDRVEDLNRHDGDSNARIQKTHAI